MKAILALEDGTQFVGESFGAAGSCIGEVVFSTGMTGYEETLTDPSLAGQILVMTYPLAGNYGITGEDAESDRIHLKGLVVRELTDQPSNFRAKETLHQYLNRNGIIGIKGIDTRALTRIRIRVRARVSIPLIPMIPLRFRYWCSVSLALKLLG